MSISAGPNPNQDGSAPYTGYYKIVADADGAKLENASEEAVSEKDYASKILSAIEANLRHLKTSGNAIEHVQTIYDKYIDKCEHIRSSAAAGEAGAVGEAPEETAKVKALYERIVNKLYTPSRPPDQEAMIARLTSLYLYQQRDAPIEKITQCVDIISSGLDEAQRRHVFEQVFPSLVFIHFHRFPSYVQSTLNKMIQYGPLIYAIPTAALHEKIVQAIATNSDLQQEVFKDLASAIFNLNLENPHLQTLINTIPLTNPLDDIFEGNFEDINPSVHHAKSVDLTRVFNAFYPFINFPIAERFEVLRLRPENGQSFDEFFNHLKTFLDKLAPEERMPILIELRKHNLSPAQLQIRLKMLNSFPKVDIKQAFDQLFSQVSLLDAPEGASTITPNFNMNYDPILQQFPEEKRLSVLKLLMTHISSAANDVNGKHHMLLWSVLNRIAPALIEETLKKLLKLKLESPLAVDDTGFSSTTKIVSNLFLEDADLMQQSYAWMTERLQPLLRDEFSVDSRINLVHITEQMTYDTLSRQNILTVLQSIPAEERSKVTEGLNPAFCQGEINQSPWSPPLPREFNFGIHLHPFPQYNKVIVDGSTADFPAASQPHIELLQLFPISDLPKVFKTIVSISPSSPDSLKALNEILQVLPKEQRAENLAVASQLEDNMTLILLKQALEVVKLFPIEARSTLLNAQTLSTFMNDSTLYRKVLRLLPESQRVAAIEKVPEMNQSLAAFIQDLKSLEDMVNWDNTLGDLALLPEELRFSTLKNLIDQVKAINREDGPVEEMGIGLRICSSSREPGDILLFLLEKDAELKQKILPFIQNKLEAFSAKRRANAVTPNVDAYYFASIFLSIYKNLGLQRKDPLVQQAIEVKILCGPLLQSQLEKLTQDLEQCALLFPAEQRADLRNNPDLLVSLAIGGNSTKEALKLFSMEERLEQLKQVREIVDYSNTEDYTLLKHWENILTSLRSLPPEMRLPTYHKLRAIEEKSIHIKEKLAKKQRGNPYATIQDLGLPNEALIQPNEQEIVDALIQGTYNNPKSVMTLLLKQDPELLSKTRTYLEGRLDLLLDGETPLDEAIQAEAQDLITNLRCCGPSLIPNEKDPLFIKILEVMAFSFDHFMMNTSFQPFKEVEALFPAEERAALRHNKNLWIALGFFPAASFLKLFPQEQRFTALPLLRTFSRELCRDPEHVRDYQERWKGILADLQVIPGDPETLRMDALKKSLELWKVSHDATMVFPRILADSPDLTPKIKTFLNQKMDRSLALENPELMPKLERQQLLELCNQIIKMRNPPNLLQIEEPLLQKAEKFIQLLSDTYAEIALLFPLANRPPLRENKDFMRLLTIHPNRLYSILKLIPEAERVNHLDLITGLTATTCNHVNGFRIGTTIDDLRMIPEENRLAILSRFADPQDGIYDHVLNILKYLIDTDETDTLLPRIHETLDKAFTKYLEGDPLGQMSEQERKEAFTLAEKICKDSAQGVPSPFLKLLNLNDDNPIFMRVAEVYIRFDPKCAASLSNPYFLLHKLKELAQTEVCLKEGPSKPVVITHADETTTTVEAALNLSELQTRAKKNIYTVEQLQLSKFPADFNPLTYFDQFFEGIKTRFKELPSNQNAEEAKAAKTRAAEHINGLFDLKMDNEPLEEMLNIIYDASLGEGTQMPFLLQVRGGPKDQISNYTFYLYAVLHSIADLSTEIPPGGLFSPREEQTLAFLQSVRECSTGQKVGIGQVYNFIDPKYQQGIALLGSVDKVNKCVDNTIQSILTEILESQSLLDELSEMPLLLDKATNLPVLDKLTHKPIRETNKQKVHQIGYLRNRYAHHLGIVLLLEFDRHPAAISKALLDATENIDDPVKGKKAKAILKRILEDIPPKLFIDKLKKSFARAAKKATEIINELDKKFDTEKAKIDAAFKAVQDNNVGTEEEHDKAVEEARAAKDKAMSKLRKDNKEEKEARFEKEHLVTEQDITNYLDETKIVVPDAKHKYDWLSYLQYDEEAEFDGVSDIAAYQILKQMGILTGDEAPKPRPQPVAADAAEEVEVEEPPIEAPND